MVANWEQFSDVPLLNNWYISFCLLKGKIQVLVNKETETDLSAFKMIYLILERTSSVDKYHIPIVIPRLFPYFSFLNINWYQVRNVLFFINENIVHVIQIILRQCLIMFHFKIVYLQKSFKESMEFPYILHSIYLIVDNLIRYISHNWQTNMNTFC